MGFPNGKIDWLVAVGLRQGEGAGLEGDAGAMGSWSGCPSLQHRGVN